jgi:uncharacterized PurR-regulated membrane protein YhhQ (DUF165 family)
MRTAQSYLPFILAMCAVVAASNYLVQFPVQAQFGGINLAEILTWGAFTYPVAFLVTDLTNRRFGPAAARIVVVSGFVLAVALSIWLATPRIAIASGSAFLVAQLLDVAVFERLRRSAWWKAPLLSSLIGSVVDTVLFFGVAFSARFAFSTHFFILGDATSWRNENRPASRPAEFTLSGGLRSGGLLGGFLGDLPLQQTGALRQLVFLRLDEEGVEAAAMLDRAQRRRGNAETVALAHGFGHQRHLAQIGKEPAPGLVVGVAHIVAGLDRLAGQFACARHDHHLRIRFLVPQIQRSFLSRPPGRRHRTIAALAEKSASYSDNRHFRQPF